MYEWSQCFFFRHLEFFCKLFHCAMVILHDTICFILHKYSEYMIVSNNRKKKKLHFKVYTKTRKQPFAFFFLVSNVHRDTKLHPCCCCRLSDIYVLVRSTSFILWSLKTTIVRKAPKLNYLLSERKYRSIEASKYPPAVVATQHFATLLDALSLAPLALLHANGRAFGIPCHPQQ